MRSDPIAALASPRRSPDGIEYRSLSAEAAAAAAGELGVPLRQVEILALGRGIVPERYQRNMGSLGLDGQIALLESRVAIVGVGGIGGTALELCARLGFGAVVLFDGDAFAESNLNRQILSAADTLGMPKVDVAARRVAAVNPAVEIVPRREKATEIGLPAAIEGCAAVIDGLDSLQARFAVARACAAASVPFVHGAVAGFSGQVATLYPGEPGLERIYGPVDEGAPGVEASTGTPAPAPVLVATLQVMEVVRIALGRGAALRGRLLLVDALEPSTRIVEL